MPNGLAIPGGVTFPILAPNGSAAAPSYSFSGAATTGFYYSSTPILAIAGTQAHTWGSDYFQINNAGARLLFSSDVILTRDAANTLAQRNSTNAQTFRLYGTYTDAGNNEYLALKANAGAEFQIIASKSGTGTYRSISFVTSGLGRWYVNENGVLGCHVDNTVDLGASGTARPRSIYAGTSFLAPDGASATPSIAFATTPGNGFYYINSTTFGVSTGALVRFVFSGVDFKVGPTGLFGFGSASALSAPDTGLGRLAAASLRLGLSPSATPIAQTFTIGEASRPGTDTDVGGASAYIRSGLGTGTGTGSSIVFMTPTLAASGSGVQTYDTRLTIAVGGITVTPPILAADGSAASPSYSFASDTDTGFRWLSSGSVLYYSNGIAGFGLVGSSFNIISSGLLRWSSSGDPSSGLDVTVARLAAASLRLGAAASATPIAQTFTIGEASRPGTDTDVGGASATIRSGLGTGTGAASSIVFQTPTLVASGSTTQTYADRLTVATAGITATVPYISASGAAATPSFAVGAANTGFWTGAAGAAVDWSIGGTQKGRLNASGFEMPSGSYVAWWPSTTVATPDLTLTRHSAANLRQGTAAANDADGTAQTLRSPGGGTVSSGTTGRNGGAYTIRSGDGSAAKAASGANGGIGGDLTLLAGVGGAGDGAGVAGANGSLIFNVGGSSILTATSAAITTTLTIHGPNGTAADPVYSFTNLLTSGLYVASAGPTIIGLSVGGTARLGFTTTGIVNDSAMLLMWSSSTPTGSVDLSIARLAAASLRLGAAPSATPVAQTFTIGEFSRVGTDNNVAGSDGTIRSGSGTGNAAGSSLFFDTPTVGASGTVQQSYGHRLTLSALGATFDIPDQGLRINNQVNGAGAAAGTLTNAPSAGNPNFWLPISIAGVTRYFPGW